MRKQIGTHCQEISLLWRRWAGCSQSSFSLMNLCPWLHWRSRRSAVSVFTSRTGEAHWFWYGGDSAATNPEEGEGANQSITPSRSKWTKNQRRMILDFRCLPICHRHVAQWAHPSATQIELYCAGGRMCLVRTSTLHKRPEVSRWIQVQNYTSKIHMQPKHLISCQ